ncbi:PAS domain S-box protein [Polaromonas sp. YR568]|uniref:PAS domain S-box protein n=1 Tax=Polaromonas sp. YR568 TaxID=1855301 RepID=UPI00398BF0A8
MKTETGGENRPPDPGASTAGKPAEAGPQSSRFSFLRRWIQPRGFSREAMLSLPACVFVFFSIGATLAVHLALEGVLQGDTALVIFTVPIMLSAYLGGLGAGLLATALTFLLASYYLLPPIYSFSVDSNAARLQQFFVALAGVIISVVTEAFHRAHRRADMAVAYNRSLIESNTDAIIVTDMRGRMTDVNQQLAELTGRSRASLVGQACRDFFTDPAGVDEVVRRALDNNKVSDHELALSALQGEPTAVSCNVSAFHSHDGRLQGVFIAVRQITERKKAEKLLFESEARTLAILAAAVDAIIIIDASGTIESLNKAAERLFGYTSPEMVGQNVKMLMPAPYKAEHDGYLRNYTGTGVKKIIGIGREVVGLRKNGETFPMELAVSEVQTGGRRLFTGIVRDITQRKHIEHSLHEKNTELERASRMKSEFLATMSHELRTPLNAIIGFSEALKDGLIGPMTDSQTEYAGDIFSSGQHLLSLINDILDLSKVEAGMMTLELEETDLKTLLSSCLSIVKEKAGAHRISLELDTSENLGVSFMDVRKTKQIAYNLLANAVKFSAVGSRVTLSARRVPRAAVGTVDGDWTVHGFPLADDSCDAFSEISVRDAGIGISAADMAKLFQAFSQIDSSLARKFEGTGLGLAMVKQLAELHGGTVAVASAEGEGALFVVWLPLRMAVD